LLFIKFQVAFFDKYNLIIKKIEQWVAEVLNHMSNTNTTKKQNKFLKKQQKILQGGSKEQ